MTQMMMPGRQTAEKQMMVPTRQTVEQNMTVPVRQIAEQQQKDQLTLQPLSEVCWELHIPNQAILL